MRFYSFRCNDYEKHTRCELEKFKKKGITVQFGCGTIIPYRELQCTHSTNPPSIINYVNHVIMIGIEGMTKFAICGISFSFSDLYACVEWSAKCASFLRQFTFLSYSSIGLMHGNCDAGAIPQITNDLIEYNNSKPELSLIVCEI